MSSFSARFFREIEGGVLEDGDEVAEALDLRLALAEFVRVVEVGKVAAGEAGVGVDERLDDLGVDLVADVALALEGDHVLEAGPGGMVTGGAKSSESPYLSETYLMNSMNSNFSISHGSHHRRYLLKCSHQSILTSESFLDMPTPIQLPDIPDAERTPVVEQLVALIERLAEETHRQAETIQQLRDEIAVLKGEKAKPTFKPSGMEGQRDPEAKTEASDEASGKRAGSAKRHKTAQS